MSVAPTETQVQEASIEAKAHAHDDAQESGDALVGLSDKAAEKVKEIRGERTSRTAMRLRLKVQGGGCSGFAYDLYFDQPSETDRTFESRASS